MSPETAWKILGAVGYACSFALAIVVRIDYRHARRLRGRR
jgi:hypothetical protein